MDMLIVVGIVVALLVVVAVIVKKKPKDASEHTGPAGGSVKEPDSHTQEK